MKCVRHPAPGVITTTDMDNHPETGDVLVVVDTCPTCQKQSRHLLAEHMEHWIMAGVKCSGLVVSGYVTVQAVPIVKYTVAVDRPYVQKLPAPKMGGQNYCVVWPDTKPGESELIQLDPRVATPGGVALILTPVPMFDECSNHRIHLCQIGDEFVIHTPLDQPIDGETEIAVPVLGSSPGSIVWDGPLGKAETNV